MASSNLAQPDTTPDGKTSPRWMFLLWQYVKSLATSTSIDAYQLSFAYGDATPTTICTARAGKVVYSVELVITEAFDGTGASLKVGDASSPDRLMHAAENDPTQVGSNTTAPAYAYGTATAVNLTITPGAGASQGRGVAFVRIQQ